MMKEINDGRQRTEDSNCQSKQRPVDRQAKKIEKAEDSLDEKRGAV